MPPSKSLQLLRREAKKMAVEREGCQQCGAGRVPQDLARFWPHPPYNARSYVVDADPAKDGPITVFCRKCFAKILRTPEGTFRSATAAELLKPPAPTTPSASRKAPSLPSTRPEESQDPPAPKVQ
jgi:ribosomal protein L40E